MKQIGKTNLSLLEPCSALENIQAESGAAPGDVEMMMLDLANFEYGPMHTSVAY